MSNSPTEQLLDDHLEAMGHLERRCLLLRLAMNSGAEPGIDFSDLECGGGELDPLVTMRHVHFPVLEEREFIRWDRENQRVTRGPRFDELEPLLELVREIRRDLRSRTGSETAR